MTELNNQPPNAAANEASSIDPAAQATQPVSAPVPVQESASVAVQPKQERISRDKALLRKSEREMGRRKLQEKLDREAKELGFSSHSELVKAYRESQKKTAPKEAVPVQESAKEQAQSNPSEERASALQKQVTLLEQQSNRLQREMRMLRREMQTRELVYEHGAKDVKYVTSLLAEAASKDGFDQEAFFKNLKKSAPYLFTQAAIESRPATTVADTAPAPVPGSSKENKPPRKSVKEMSKAEYAEWKSKTVGVRHPFG